MNYPKYWAEYIFGRRIAIYELITVEVNSGYFYFKRLREDGKLIAKKQHELERFDFIPFLIDGGRTRAAA